MQTRLYYDEENKCYLEEEVTEDEGQRNKTMIDLHNSELLRKSLEDFLAENPEMLRAAFCPEDKREIFSKEK